jgi:hypothetical protein
METSGNMSHVAVEKGNRQKAKRKEHNTIKNKVKYFKNRDKY